MAQIKELQSENTKKDMEIQLLKQKLSIVQTGPNENMNIDLKKSEDLQNTTTGNTKEQWKYLFNELQKKSNGNTCLMYHKCTLTSKICNISHHL